MALMSKTNILAEVLSHSPHDPTHPYCLDYCIECGGLLLQNKYEIVCRSCGLVHARVLCNPLNPICDFPDAERPVCHHSISRLQGTYIGYLNFADGRKLSVERQETLQRLRKIQKTVRNQKQRRKKPYMERALILYEYKCRYYLANEELGKLVDLGKTQVGTLISLIKLPPEIQQGITDGWITVEAAKSLSKLAFDVHFPVICEKFRELLNSGLMDWDFNWEAEPEAWKAKRTRLQLEFFEKIKFGDFSKKEGNKALQSIINDLIAAEKQQRKQRDCKSHGGK